MSSEYCNPTTTKKNEALFFFVGLDIITAIFWEVGSKRLIRTNFFRNVSVSQASRDCKTWRTRRLFLHVFFPHIFIVGSPKKKSSGPKKILGQIWDDQGPSIGDLLQQGKTHLWSLRRAVRPLTPLGFAKPVPPLAIQRLETCPWYGVCAGQKFFEVYR